MEDNRIRWHLVTSKIEAVWLIVFGAVVLGFVRSGELILFLEPGWIRFTEVFGYIFAIGGAAVLLYCRDNEKSNVLYRASVTGKRDLSLRFFGVGLLILVLISTAVAPYYTIVQDPYSAVEIGGSPFAAADESIVNESENRKPEDRDYRDWMILFGNHPELSIFEGEAANITGEVAVDERMPEGFFFLRRKVVTHCEDCAEYISVTCRVTGGADVPAAGKWIQAEGRFRLEKVASQSVLVLDVKDYEAVKEPDDPYVHLH